MEAKFLFDPADSAIHAAPSTVVSMKFAATVLFFVPAPSWITPRRAIGFTKRFPLIVRPVPSARSVETGSRKVSQARCVVVFPVMGWEDERNMVG